RSILVLVVLVVVLLVFILLFWFVSNLFTLLFCDVLSETFILFNVVFARAKVLFVVLNPLALLKELLRKLRLVTLVAILLLFNCREVKFRYELLLDIFRYP